MTKVVVLQSNYLPWKGYFDLIHDAEMFVFYDDLQYTKNDWRNRNKFKTPKGCEWITIPAGSSQSRLICEVTLNDPSWQKQHWNLIHQHYGKSPYFKMYAPFFEDFFLSTPRTSLSELNQHLIRHISAEFLGIGTKFVDSRDYNLSGHKLDRLVELVCKVGATTYISGPAAKDYIEPERFREQGIDLVWKDYSGYPGYPQSHPPFDHAVSIIDLLFCTGPNAPWYIWGWRDGSAKPA
jgi:hypothetical protein